MSSECFKEGKKAYYSGFSSKDNPYEPYSEDHNQWRKGFKTGEKEDSEQDPNGN